jgi:hypothetical protein
MSKNIKPKQTMTRITKDTLQLLDSSRAAESGKRGKVISRTKWIEELIRKALQVFGYK